ncbi:SRPBCC family protein [Paludisphaera rhizosphaerae]|uniref:SRPBCC family protein n=1 Tax=Paludisphaera rhizosphaerae TaxID=2711216 RepID=UPI0013ED6208|nr:SRPBCC family protein [Paludisphaera rhizosphaerae]
MASTQRLQWEVDGVVNASLEATWAALDDLSLIPKYHPVVRQVEFLSGVGRREPGVEYKCIIPTGPQRGWCVEKVIDHVPFRRSTVAFTADSWGLSRLIDDFLTEIIVEPAEGSRTHVVLRGFYNPKGWRGAILNALMIRRTMKNRARDTIRGFQGLMKDKGGTQERSH